MIFEKLQKARVALQSKQLKKSGENKYAGFKYYELCDFLPQVNIIFEELKLCSNFSISEGIATLKITDWEDQTFEVFTSPIETLELKGCTKIQALGGVHTYLKRYLYLNALEIVENDMLDAQAGNIEPDKTQEIIKGLEATKTSSEAEKYYKANNGKVKDLEAFKKAYSLRYRKLKAQEQKEVANG